MLDLRLEALNVAAATTGELLLTPLDDGDAEIVTALVRRHHAETDSPVAAQLLADLPAALARFTRILPAQYARVRAALATAEAQGTDLSSPGAWAEILEVARG